MAREIIHAVDVRRDAEATGTVPEKLPQDRWACIMRHKDADGYV